MAVITDMKDGPLDQTAPVVTARIYPRQYEELRVITAAEGQTTSGFIRRLIEEEIKRNRPTD